MRTSSLAITIALLLATTICHAMPPVKKPLINNLATRNPAVEKVDKDIIRPWLLMEVTDFRTLWNGRPLFTYTLTNRSSHASDQLEVTISYAEKRDGSWNEAEKTGIMSMAPGAAMSNIIQTFPRGTKWIRVEIRQDLKPGKPLVCSKIFAARYAGPVIDNVAQLAGDKSGPALKTTILNPTVERFKDSCTISYIFSDSPRLVPITSASRPAYSLQIPAESTTIHTAALPPNASRQYLTVVIRGLYDTIATRQFKREGRVLVPLDRSLKQ